MLRPLKIILINITTCIIILFGSVNFFAYAGVTQNTNLNILDIRFYGYFEGADNVIYYIDDNVINVKKGETLRHEFNRFDKAEGVITEIMDIEVTVSNEGDELIVDQEIKLTIFPKVASIIYVKGFPPDLIDQKRSKQTAKLLESVIQRSKKISELNAKSTGKIVFEKINLKEIIDKYAAQKKWPVELKIEISQKSKAKGKTYKSNKVQRYKFLKIPFPAY